MKELDEWETLDRMTKKLDRTTKKCSYSGELKVVLTTVPTASKLLIKFSINVLTHSYMVDEKNQKIAEW